MKKIYLLKTIQKNMISYTGKADARDLARLATNVELNAVQEAQRPLNPKRLEEISDFVSSGGLLSTSIVIGTCNDNLEVYPVENFEGLYYVEFPETDEEFEKMKDSFDLMDGQHRIFSFLPEYTKISKDEIFEISFEMYIKPTKRQRQIIFKNTNEKQEKVSSNLLLWFREQLGMLTERETKYHAVVSLLNSEVCSPLKGRIVMGAEKISGGYKAEQIIKLFEKADIVVDMNDEIKLQMLSKYLCGWEYAVESKIISSDKELGAFSKISGLRFMIFMLPALLKQANKEEKDFTCDYISKKLKEFFSNYGMEPRDLFDINSKYRKSLELNPFTAETSTIKFAKLWVRNFNDFVSKEGKKFDSLAYLTK